MTCDIATIEQTVNIVCNPGAVYELRILHAGRAQTVSGYFDDMTALVQAAAHWSGKAPGVYLTLNPCDPALLARSTNQYKTNARVTTSDKESVRRSWLPVDCDAVRPTGISATNAKHAAARARITACVGWLTARGWPAPVMGDSGNGGHALYAIDLPNDDTSRDLIKHCLEVLAMHFSDDVVTIDTGVFNAARIWKLYGTLVCKGDHVPERPHRLAQLLDVPAVRTCVTLEQLTALAAMLPAPPEATAPRSTGRGLQGTFDPRQWIASHGLFVARETDWSSGHRWILNPCPWNSAHTNKSAYIVQLTNGAMAAGCHHNGCAGNDWYALRDLCEPGWREKRRPRQTKTTGAAPRQGDPFGLGAEEQAATGGTTEGPAATLAAWLVDLEAQPADARLAVVLADIEKLALVPLADWMTAKPKIKRLVPTCSLRDLEKLRTATLHDRDARTHDAAQATDETAEPWLAGLNRQKNGIPYESIGNFVHAITHMEPWKSQGCWYDLVRECHMVGGTPVKDGDDTAAAVLIEAATGTPVTKIALVGRALDHVCRSHERDLLCAWVDTLDTVPITDLLTTWLRTYAHVPQDVPDAYVADVSRIIVVGIIARILLPACQFRDVVILEGPENAGKSKLTKELAGRDCYGQSWHVGLSSGLENKEAHMMLEGALIAELEELASYGKTEDNRMKALITAEYDSFVPKFSNKRANHPRRTVFLGTVNPEGDGTYFRGQTGNTRFLPITVQDIDIAGFLKIRTQLFAEAKAYVLAHEKDWWKLDCDEDARAEREKRRLPSVYEGQALRAWLARRTTGRCTWDEVAEFHLQIPKDRWTKALQMEIGKALRAEHWRRDHTTTERYWVPDEAWDSRGIDAKDPFA
jgi:hypothetical protein